MAIDESDLREFAGVKGPHEPSFFEAKVRVGQLA